MNFPVLLDFSAHKTAVFCCGNAMYGGQHVLRAAEKIPLFLPVTVLKTVKNVSCDINHFQLIHKKISLTVRY